jgi:hypothetical protein
MSKKIEQLTAEQEAILPVIRDKWIRQLYDLKDIDMDRLIEGINWLYDFCKLSKPKIIICQSILEAHLVVHVLKNRGNSSVHNVGDSVCDNVCDGCEQQYLQL